MRASLDTNVIIHLYRAGLQNILFDIFEEVYIYEQLRNIELANHGADILDMVDTDIAAGRISLYTNQALKDQAVFTIFENKVKENRLLYQTGDLGEVYAISLAQTLGAYSIVTDDTKQGGPYMSLLQFEDDVMPFTFADVLILRYIFNYADVSQTIHDFETINSTSDLNWSFRSHVAKFVRRFFKEPYRQEDTRWLKERANEYGVNIKEKLQILSNKL